MELLSIIITGLFYTTLLAVCFAGPVVANETIGESIDCTDVSVDYKDDKALTREERLSLMDRALFESLDKFELCQAARAMAQSSAASAAADGASGTGGGEVTGDEEGTGGTGQGGAPGGSVESVASSTMSGSEEPSTQPSTEGMGGLETADQDASISGQSGNQSSGGAERRTAAGSNGKNPDDIPTAANDDTLAAQIRYAAENETDPVKKAQLWNEYRKYRGLPEK